VVGTIIHSVSSGSAPSAQQMAELVDQMRASGAIAIFMETGSNPQLAEQLSTETGIKVVYDLYTHSISKADGNAPSYIGLMKYNVEQMVRALAE
jgi:ABC-type Zn uptake system ZnuABC Zn-binding protein ZnuA